MPDRIQKSPLIRIILLFSCILVGVSPLATAQDIEFDTFTFKADSTVTIGYPRGWTIQEQFSQDLLGAIIQRDMTGDSPGYIVFFIPMVKNAPISTAAQLSNYVTDYLRQSSLPGLQVTRQSNHSNWPAVRVSRMSVAGDVKYAGESWSTVISGDSVNVGVFALFFAPVGEFAGFNTDTMLTGVLGPPLNLEQPAYEKAQTGSQPISQGGGPGILFVGPGGSGRTMYSMNVSNWQPSGVENLESAGATEPAFHRGTNSTVFAVQHATSPYLYGKVNGSAFRLQLPRDKEISVRHPSISRDGRLLAFSIKSSKHVGNVNVLDDTGTQVDSYMAVGSWYRIVSVDTRTGKQVAVYYADELVPDVMRFRGMGPVFSPVDDILAYADSHALYFCQSRDGKVIGNIPVPQIQSGGWSGQALVSEYSGLAFSPDGRYLAYLSQGEADIPVNPHLLMLVDIKSGQARSYRMPDHITAWTPSGLICLDFSPDGGSIVFSASGNDNAGNTVGPFLCLLDLAAGTFTPIESSFNGFAPVWKGR